MRLKLDRNRDMAAFIAAIEQNHVEMEKALLQVKSLFAAGDAARKRSMKAKSRKSPDRPRL
jgi:hypothetical protein